MTTTALDLTRALEERGAILSGHFRLSSGRHSPTFIQKFRILEVPALVERIAAALIVRLSHAHQANVVLSAAVGGIILGYEVARQLGARAIFVEKEGAVATLRRGFALGPDDRAIVVEDVVTTGGSVREILSIARERGAAILGLGVIVRREPVDFGVPTVALVDLPVVSYDPSECPQCKAGKPITEPGARFLR
jgi:orotate phosphoribosyltransferase